MTTQTTYKNRMDPARAGMIHGSDFKTDTALCETAAGIGFGLAVSQGSSDRGVILGGASEDFRGITVRDVTLVHQLADVDKYIETENMSILTRGFIWVLTGSAVAAGDAVHFNASTGVLSNSGGELLQGARWASSAGNGGYAQVELSGFNNMAAT